MARREQRAQTPSKPVEIFRTSDYLYPSLPPLGLSWQQGSTPIRTVPAITFQSVRELLLNVSKHAGTGQASVTLDHRDDLLHITVSDHGKGFDSAAVTSELPADGMPDEKLSSNSVSLIFANA